MDYFDKLGEHIGKIMAVIDLIEAKGTRPDLMKNLFELNKRLKKFTKVR